MGGGHGELYGDVQGPVMPRTVLNGIDMTKMLSRVLKFGPNTKFVQGAFASCGSSEAVGQEHIECAIRVNKARQEPDAIELATVEEVGAINDYCLSMHDVNDKQCVIGQVRNPVGGPPHAFVWPSGQVILDIGTFGGPFSNAFCVNDKNQVVGTAHVDNSAAHAFLWQEGHGLRDLGTLGGRDSVGRSINKSCQVVGESFVGTGDPSQEAQRAFLWTPDGGMIDLGRAFEGWSRAREISDNGVVLGCRLRGAVVCGFVWSADMGVIDLVGAGGRPFYPCAINNVGLVIGEGDDSFGKRRAFCWTREQGLRQLTVADDFHPCDVDQHGNIAGNVHSRPWNRPYLFNSITGDFLPLPFVEDHHTSVKAINDSGVIVGAAWTGSWKHTHPLVWHLLNG